tara:strand:+ start:201 stop:356 length:156 start_codon:yes stop_codon:yes gene_type:complete
LVYDNNVFTQYSVAIPDDINNPEESNWQTRIHQASDWPFEAEKLNSLIGYP